MEKKKKRSHKALWIILAVIAALFIACWIFDLVWTNKMTSEMTDPFMRPEKQVFNIDPAEVSSISVQNGNGDMHEFEGDERTWAIDKLNGFKAKEINGLIPLDMSGWSYRVIIEKPNGEFGSYRLYDNAITCENVIFRGAKDEFSDFINYVPLPTR